MQGCGYSGETNKEISVLQVENWRTQSWCSEQLLKTVPRPVEDICGLHSDTVQGPWL